MKQDASPTPKAPKHRTESAAHDEADWPLDQIKELARELYIRFPFDDEDTERWKDLVQEAFWVFDNLDNACKEILRERAEDRKAGARREEAHKKLTSIGRFDKAVRYITGEKRTERAESKLEKVLSYEARIVPWEGWVLPKLPAKEKRRLEAQTKKWRQRGIAYAEAVRLQSLCDRYWPDVVAEQNSAKRKKHKRRARVPRDSNTKEIIRAVVREKMSLT